MKAYTPPPDKSVTIRALLLGAVADGSTRVENPLYCADTGAALACLEALGVRHCRDGGALIIEGRGLDGLKKPAGPLDAGESAALARMLAGLLAGQSFPSVIAGRGTLLKRPMAPAADALKKLGARVAATKGLLPLTIKPARLKGARVSGVTSAQVKSALLLAGLYAAGPVEVKEKFGTRDHTERLLALLGAALSSRAGLVRLRPGRLTARPLAVPGDVSSAAPLMAAALLRKEPLKIEGCGLNPTRLGFVDALVSMGAKIKMKRGNCFPEPCGELEVRPSALKAAKLAHGDIPSLIDEVPLLAVLAATAKGVTRIAGIEGLKTKESDRVKSTLALLASLGARAEYKKGALIIPGGQKLRAAAPVDTFSDHRIAMAAAAASAVCPALEIENPGCVDKSYPGFWSDFRSVFGGPLRA
ncbi:MAG: 3-phosphoshikimate 1-carboxyvinyltransferase [Elusimicrobia bacterium]|nr:3-phosphoshikimate 1-carboxyvinyltransferase [Elusimicrobiota bacterium]